MEYRSLGATGVRVSAFALGTGMFGPSGNADVAECQQIVSTALDSGINFIDTADAYSGGAAEEIVGAAIRDRRDEVILATKFHNRMGPGINEFGNSRLWIMRAVEASLRRLQTDHIDLYQVHRPHPETDIDETLGALSDLVSQGKVRYIGSTTFQAWQIVEAQVVSAARGLARFVTEQPPYSIMVRSVERDVLAVAEKYRLGVVAWSPMAGGWLSGQYQRGRPPSAGSRAARLEEYRGSGNRMFDRYNISDPRNAAKYDLLDGLGALAAEAGLPMVHLALAFPLAHPAVASCIVGPRTLDQLRSLLTGADVRLNTQTLDAIDELIAPGTVLNSADLGWDPPWLTDPARRRRGQPVSAG
jgi:aryl-alcohol dehydrogenase-like predicted oxidoreductase